MFSVPYGTKQLDFDLPDGMTAQVVVPPETPAAPDPTGVVEAALDCVDWGDWRGARAAAIAINDKTRPVPHAYLLPPLLRRLEGLGLAPDAIQLIIATGAHSPMPPEEYSRVMPADILARYPVLCHDSDDRAGLQYRGQTRRGTPIWVNGHFAAADLRIVVGDIEPHQFQGFSGGVKSAAIGLAGRDTINHNHALMTDPRAQLGRYADNPARQDVEDIGQAIGVHLALNAILNGQKDIVHVLAGEPRALMEAGVPLSRAVCQVTVAAPFDLVIASPGGHPKDINVYQAQKALAHASLVTRDAGAVIVAAACPEGAGSRGYESWTTGLRSHPEVTARFEREGFRVGPHKAYLIARDASRVRVFWVTDMAPDHMRALLLDPAVSLEAAIEHALSDLPTGARVGIMPQASSTIPHLADQPAMNHQVHEGT
ncbi:MAG: nickel-dependent lactate racemase [Chloroflexi bacterium]|nr:nickel-dependent lactate racemase [Chloroflexota bacterium]MBU1751701.1 nickel-dependent lactate racemase [Chloroflexota bacterium]MBU1880192.1 nickel-dependent lactate racemase [Chloroflexota bacterium]